MQSKSNALFKIGNGERSLIATVSPADMTARMDNKIAIDTICIMILILLAR